MDMWIIEAANGVNHALLIFPLVKLANSQQGNVIFGQAEFSPPFLTGVFIRCEAVQIYADPGNLLHPVCMERLCPLEILLVDGDDHIAQAGAIPFHRVVKQPIAGRGAVIKVKTMDHVNHFRSPFPGVSGSQAGHDPHHRLVCPDHIPALAVNDPLQFPIAPAVTWGKRAADQMNLANFGHALQGLAQLIHPAAYRRAGKLHGKPVLGQVFHVGHQKLDGH